MDLCLVGSEMCIRDRDTVYTSPETGSPYCALQSGDEIVKVNGKKINVMHSFEDYVANAQLGKEFTVTVLREGETTPREIKLTVQKITQEDGSTYTGFGIQTMRDYRAGNVGQAFAYCVPFTGKMAWTILGSFVDLIAGKIAITSLTGPVGTVGMMASASAADWRNIFVLLPLIAANLGLFNLLPIPALDGSKVIFTVIEWIRGKPINRRVENTIHTVGLLLLFAFVIVVDIIGMVLR
jgi:regulator of sigma E protease